MVRATLSTLGLLILFLAVSGCETAAVGKRDQAFVDYYPLMSEEQRVNFGSLRRVEDRQDFLIQHGLDIALFLENNLVRGMDQAQVSEILGQPWNVETHTARFGKNKGEHADWFYRDFEGRSREVIYSTRFKDGALQDWRVWRKEIF